MRRHERWLPLLVAAAAVAAFANSVHGVFLFDDSFVILGNRGISEILPFRWGRRALVDFTFRLDYARSGLDVFHYHVTNIVIHLTAGMVLAGLVRRILLRPRFNGRYDAASAWLAAAAATLWAVHPLQTESVTYVCQRYELLMGLFWLCAFYCCVRGYGSPLAWAWWWGAFLVFAVGLATKEVIVTFPALAIVYDHVFENGAIRKAAMKRWRMISAIALLFLVAGYPVLRSMADGVVGQGGRVHVPWFRYLATQPGVILHYLRLVFRPHPLCLDYAWPPAQGVFQALAPGLVVAGLLSGALLAAWRRMPVGFAGLCFFVILAPTSSVLPMEDAAFEHRMYLPLAPILVLVVVLAYEGTIRLSRTWGPSQRTTVRVAAVGCLVFVFLCLTRLTMARNADYASESGMWRRNLECRPDNLRARVALAAALLAEGDIEQAGDMLSRTLRELPTEQGRVGYSLDYVRGKALNGLGVVEEQRGNLDASESLFRAALAVDAGFKEARTNLGVVLEKMGRVGDAREEWRKVVQDSPGDAKARFCLAVSLRNEGDCKGAAEQFHAMGSPPPDMLNARLAFAWLLATCPDSDVRDGEKAIGILNGICPTNPVEIMKLHDIRGAALAQEGRFEAATEQAEEALRVGRKYGVTGTSGLAARLDRYRAGESFVETKQPRD